MPVSSVSQILGYLHSLLAPYGNTPRILEAPQSYSVQLAYALQKQGVALTASGMSACLFPGLISLPFMETLPEVQLGLTAMENNTSAAINTSATSSSRCLCGTASPTQSRRVLHTPPSRRCRSVVP